MQYNNIEGLFLRELQNVTTKEEEEVENKCCNHIEREFLKTYAHILKRSSAYKEMDDRDIYLTLVYVYYGLNLNEQSTDWLGMDFLERKSKNKTHTKKLYLDLTTQDVEININISSAIRTQMMGIKPEGP